ncbi:uncharacterized protein LOC106710086 [Papilio machaon]|uniref:uncharacterized protein LOC106710086 n=1 Tax=Papilio machaon TaxID=76193 RepID=UPI001E663DC4|nr:uncharacterized protein LOC106710086 [Papilio machaon]
MTFKVAVLLATVLAISLAVPTPRHEFSDFFIHADPNARIVGGSQAAEGSVPYMVAMTSGLMLRSLLCGGSLISARHVLTAAHCIDAVYSSGALSRYLRVTVGTNRWNSGGQSYNLSRNVTHPNYVSTTIKNDIGILVTSTNVVFSNLVQPVVLSYDHIGAGVRSKAAGWGRTRQSGSMSAALQRLIVTTIDGQQCVRDVGQRAAELNLRAPPVEPHIELCVYHSPGHGMCNGDSGSALVIESSSLQIGIVSWGLPCARGAPDMFVRVSAYRDWITRAMVNYHLFNDKNLQLHRFGVATTMVFKFEVILLVLFVSIFGATSYEYGTSDLFIHAESRGRILGGVPADEGAVPYIAAVAVGTTVRSFLCAGSLFTTKHILTVAHCITALYRNGSLVNSLSITVGTNSWNSGGQTYNISGNITHPDFDPKLVINDIGFLIVSTDVDLSKSVQLIILSYENIGAGVETTVAGWGRVNRTTPVSSELLELEMTTVEGQQCAKEVKANAAKFRMRVPPVEPRLMLCAYHSVNHGVCNGDSGSPLVEVSTGKQIGLVSWGMPCALGTPDMFTRVSAYQTWIQQTMTISNNTGAVNETKATET